MTRGKFITLEGMDGAGKSTHLTWIPGFLEARGVKVQLTREPGGTLLGERLRELMLDKDQKLHSETEALLMFAARREHLHKVILPALDAGAWVVWIGSPTRPSPTSPVAAAWRGSASRRWKPGCRAGCNPI